ncbi:MAG: hypothetical protein IT451_11845 [Candidatus Brocadia sp.]|nr:hypothetical protein [Candidatus Brocadia sp.]
MRKVLLACVLVMLFGSKVYADGAIFVPIQHSDLLNSGTNTHAIIDTFIASKGQPNGLAALDGSGNIVVSGYIGATNGTGTGTRLDNVQINSGTGTLSGVPSPYIAQTSGTSTGGSHTSSYIYGSSTIQSTSTSDSYLSGNFAVGSTTPPCKFLVLVSQLSGHVKYVDTQALIEKNGNTALEIASNSTNSGSLVFSDENSTGGLISYSHILDRLAIYVGHNLASLGNPQFTVNSSGSVTASNLVTSWKAGSTEGYGQLNFASTGDINFATSYDSANKIGTITAGLTGTTSAKPNLSTEAGLVATGPGTITFHTNFNVTSTGTVKLRDVVQQTSGTATGLVIANASITSGSGTLSGVASPYVAQTSGTGTLLNIGSVSVNHNGASITGGTISGVDMCFGDNDTGVNWVADGNIQVKTNDNVILELNSNTLPSTVQIGNNSSKVTTTHYGTFTSTNLIEVTSGGVKYPDGITQSKAATDILYASARRTGSLTVNAGTWTNVGLDASGELYGFTHPGTANSQLRLTASGVYRISGKIQARGSGGSIGIRVCKNTQSELTGGTSLSYMNYGDGNSGMPIIITPFLADLSASDYIYMQVAHNFSGASSILDYGILGTQPNFGTITTAVLTIEKIGE